MRTLILGLVLLGAVAAFVTAGLAKDKVPAAAAPLGAHPHFDDGGALEWATSLAQARAAAKRSGKLIFIEFGREA